ncbi:MAG TPA: helix-turn-helix domain-containing protein [Actinophytocola sp.]|uniref:PucR family transcriptional regulator n=1 Tax=Actinophytocola sp. TaxID=1872138 RepID=UPI002DDCBB3D|nr:helix-turn-helix domain-containing protein [Actinophytocola sp.]HEV2779721.1 helix-turn-helix domain-containing protein [Actinophytocola sp.]
MSDLLSLLRRRVDANAREEVSAYIREFPEYRRKAARAHARAEMLDYAVWSRRRTIELVRENRPLLAEDLAYIAAIGEKRARQGMSTRTARQVLALHANLMLREIHEVACHDHLTDLLRLTAWFGPQGARGTAAFLQGYVAEQEQRLTPPRRLRMATQLLLANDPAASRLAEGLGLRVQDRYRVAVIRVAGTLSESDDEVLDDLVESIFQQYRLPVTWQQPNELVVLIPWDGKGSLWDPGSIDDRTLSVVRDIGSALGRPCQVGAATGQVPALTEALELARRVATVAPVEKVPRAVYGVADVFVELSVAQVPEVDQSLRAVAHRLANGPDLVTTLDAYYRNDMNRLGTAAALHIHPRTLDYRLQRVRDLAEVDPASVRGVRILSATVTRALSGAWS